ncbi:uncharacterized protein Tco025E_03533 [Trypanosoma conorhini]|uniref:Uncharacterized protein n=1 Tax=Trypanosoma conorhini TaxID=83891 RepID=A0A3R7LUQ1_9TRYP|nr:uncharacterized protein Tco025E_03533 [Trypanosoma conorhini]RNF21080.1 hypothetical protein Tco025E_03533 [Trypanosoma conorhini]
MHPKTRRPQTQSESASELLGSTLAALDAVIADAQRQDAGSAPQAGKKRQRGGAVFAAMAEPHLHALQSLVVTYGVQLLPSLDAVARRALLAVASPTTANTAAWELAALLGTYFRAGAVRLLEELMELLLTDKGPFLLKAPCLVGLTRARGGAEATEEEDEEEDDTVGLLRRLCAFEELLLAVGPCISASVMQRATLRFAQEVVIAGILDAPPPAPPAESGKPGRGKKGGPNATNINSDKDQHNNTSGAQLQATASAAAFSVEAAVQPRCVQLLTSLLLLCRPLPGVVSACAVRVVRELPARAVTLRQRSEHPHLLRAVARLSATLTALRHPHALPFYLPPVDVVEKPTRRVTADVPSAGVEQTTGVNDSHPSSPASAPQQQPGEVQQQAAAAAAAATTTVCARPAEPSPPRQPAQAVQQQHSLVEATRNSRQGVPAAAAVKQLQGRQRSTLVATPLPAVPAAVACESDDEDDMPEIDIED